MMKRIIIAMLLFSVAQTALGQNTFPSSGKVGIGTTSPYSILEINPTAVSWGEGIVVNPSPNNYNAIFFRETAGTYNGTWFVGRYNNSNFSILREGLSGLSGTSHPTSTFEINHSNGRATFGGDVNIGVSNPQATLHVKRGTASWGTAAFDGTQRTSHFNYSTDEHTYIRGGKTNSNVFLNDNGGDVGIGTTNPGAKLDVVSNGTANHGVRLVKSSGQRLMSFYETSAGSGALAGYSSSNSNTVWISGEGDSFLNGGDFGIGTTSPSKLLHLSSSAPSLLIERTGSVSWETRIDNNGRFIIQDATNTTEPIKVEAQAPTATLYAKSNGNVGIGTADPKAKLAVNGKVRATEVKVMADISVPDYVFEEDYELRTLQETKEYITANKHLPEIPSASEIGENGFDLGDMNMRLLKKIEELTLHQIELLERLERQSKELEQVKERLEALDK